MKIKSMQRSYADIDFIAEEYVLISISFCVFTLCAIDLLFVCHLQIDTFSPWLMPAVLLATTAWRLLQKRKRTKAVIAAALVSFVWVAVITLSHAVVDVSYDGVAYHQVAIIALSRGWNPVYAPHVVSWWNLAFPAWSWLGDTIADHGMWPDHYPKAAWILGAAVTSALQSLNSSKWLAGFLGVTAAVALCRGLAVVGVPRGAAVALGIAGALSPVVIAQASTNLIDGVLGSILLIQMGASLAWIYKRRTGDLSILLMAFVLAANIKFTGIIYSGVFLVVVATYGWRRFTNLRFAEIAIGVCAVLLFTIASSQTYILNIIEHNHPFYPLNKLDIISSNMNNDFLARPRLQKLFTSSFSIPSNSSLDDPAAGLFLPKAWHYSNLSIHGEASSRVNGFGSLFGWSLLASVGGALFCFASKLSRARLRPTSMPILVIMAGVVISSVANPELWWARYVPQLWLLPVLLTSIVFMAGRRILGICLTAPIVLGSALCFVFWVGNTFDEQRRLKGEQHRIVAAGHADIQDGLNKNHGVFVFVTEESKVGIDVRIVDGQASCPHTVLVRLVAVCDDLK